MLFNIHAKKIETETWMAKMVVPNFKIILSERDKRCILSKTRSVLDSSHWTSGPVAGKFEKAFTRYTGASYAVAVSNGGAAIAAILQALHIPKNSIVICPTLTAPPTPHSILLAGMRVVFVDSSSDDLGIDLEDVEKNLKQHKDEVKAVIAVHVGGWVSPRIKKLDAMCRKYGVFLVEDCAHAHGSFLNGEHAGSTGKAAAYSFFMTKSLTCGEGGIVTSEDKKIIDEISIIRNYGKDKYGNHVMNGFNYKFSEFNATIALWAAANAPRIIKDRRKVASNYNRLLKGLKGISVFNVPQCRCGYYKYIITLERGIDRDDFKEALLYKYGIEPAGGVYDTLCHQEPYFKSIPARILNVNNAFPQAEEFAKSQVCLPLYGGLKRKDQEYIAESIRMVLRKI